jgi:hypothetical protein
VLAVGVVVIKRDCQKGLPVFANKPRPCEEVEQVRSIVAGRQGRYSLWSLMFGGGFFFLDQFVNKPWHAATAETPRWLIFCFPLWVTHEAFVERFFRSYEVIVIKSQLAALAAL